MPPGAWNRLLGGSEGQVLPLSLRWTVLPQGPAGPHEARETPLHPSHGRRESSSVLTQAPEAVHRLVWVWGDYGEALSDWAPPALSQAPGIGLEHPSLWGAASVWWELSSIPASATQRPHSAPSSGDSGSQTL